MKSLADLKKIRDEAAKKLKMRHQVEGVHVTVSMGTCGIAAGARPVLNAFVEEVNKMFSIGEVQKVMQGLLKEQVSIRNTVAILETMADYGPLTKKTELLVEKVRQRLGRQICLQYCDDNKILHVLTIEPSFLQKLLDSRYESTNGYGVALDPVEHRQWISSLSNYIAAVKNEGYLPVILCPEEARILVKISTEREMPNLVVLSIPEIDKEIKLESLGEVKVG